MQSVLIFYTLSVCLSVCEFESNVKTAEPVGPKYCVGPPHMYDTKIKSYMAGIELGVVFLLELTWVVIDLISLFL